MGNYRKSLGAAPAVVVSSGPAGSRLWRARSRRLAVLAGAVVLMGASAASAQQEERWKLVPSDGAEGDLFGVRVAVFESTALIGAPDDDDQGEDSGSAYLFDTNTGAQLRKLFPDDGSPGARFGVSVAISDSVALVTTTGTDYSGGDVQSLYLFDLTTGDQLAKLVPSDMEVDDGFGICVAISGTTAIVGAHSDNDNGARSGSAYLFDVITGAQIAKLLPSDGAEDGRFGSSVALSDTTAVVGSTGDDQNGPWSGSAYLFDLSTGDQIAKLLPTDGAEGDHFGLSVAISGSIVLVGTPHDDDNGSSSGSAYLFDANTGEQLAKLLPSDGGQGNWFGIGVALTDTTALIGAAGDSPMGNSAGSAYIFDIATGDQTDRLFPSDTSAGDHVGYEVAISDSVMVIGAYGDAANGTRSGSAYVFSPPCGEADLTGDGIIDTLDFLLFLGAWAQGNPLADWDQNGVIDTRDFVAYLNDWVVGC